MARYLEEVVETLTKWLGSWLDVGLGLFYPPVCQLCGEGRATAGEGFVCANCRAQARFIEPPFCERCGRPYEGAITSRFECGQCAGTELHFGFARSAVAARDPVLEVIHRYKYRRELCFEVFLADLLIRRAKPDLAREKWDYIVPIPLHPTKEREREFNQAERLARRLSRATGIPLNKRLVRRVIATRTQTRLNRQERLDNVRHAFALRNGGPLAGKRIVLVDDVFTTGATSGACAKVLRKAGADEVCVWTLARGI